MAATTISRATITDDSGNGTSGTVFNSAWFGTGIYDKIDALFSTLGVTRFETSGAGSHGLLVRNTAAGVANDTSLALGTNTSEFHSILAAFSSTYTTSGVNIQDSTLLRGQGAGGMSLAASNIAGILRFYSGGTTERARFLASGHLVFEELTTNPGTGDMTADAALACYTKSDKLVFAYNNGGTMTYITLDLDGSDITFTHGTSAP